MGEYEKDFPYLRGFGDDPFLNGILGVPNKRKPLSNKEIQRRKKARKVALESRKRNRKCR